jgi:transposase
MQVLYLRCCGLDVHLKTITACVLIFDGDGQRIVRKKQFETHAKALNLLVLWLCANKVTHVAMESTGVYWKPVWNALEKHFSLILANPYQVKNLPGCKTDPRDAEWIADLLAHGLIKPSFVPPREIRDLRDLTRHRVKLVEERNRIHNRIHKVLEDASLKLDTVVSDILGASGRAIIEAIIAGQEHPDWLADKAKGTLRNKRNQLRLVLRGRIREHHRWMLRELMQQLQFAEDRIASVEAELCTRMQPHQSLVDRLCTIPGVDILTAWSLLAELGTDMSVFPDAKHAASWAGLCPGNHQSAGKRLSNRTRKGNRWVRRALCQSAWAVSHKKNSYLTAFFYRKAARHGMKKAVVATAHQILLIAYCILRDGTVYRELGNDYFDALHPARTQQRLVARLERLGLDVTIVPRKVSDHRARDQSANV